jgi:hypothetical protein
LVADTTGLEEQEREKRRQVIEKFQKAPFEEIAAHCESKVAVPETWAIGSPTRQTLRMRGHRANWLYYPRLPQANMLHDRLAQIFELTIR